MSEPIIMKTKASFCHIVLALIGTLLSSGGALAQDVITYFHTDVTGSPIAATDANGNVLWREDYSPYGERLRQENSLRTNHMWFTGHHHDDDSGLTYAGARHYDPMIGRFMGVDPAEANPGNQFSFSRYAYANNNPYGYVDPNGSEAVGAQWLISTNAMTDRVTNGLSSTESGSFSDFLLNSTREVGLTYGENSWSLAYWNVSVGGFTDASNDALHGDLTAATVGAATVLIKPARILKGPLHHLATNKNWVSILRGGPWSPRFEAIFKKAGMSLDDALNKAHIPGHAGPHPEAYHQAIFQRLSTATEGLSGDAYRDALRSELEAIRKDALSPGNPLNRLLTE